ncbi:MAG: glycine betaine/L-proline ABC transporter ATP-binding protein [Eubacteriales bacterium]|nr:glycine betaine/L-proline ABC transporter ATP-binding protein [Eubacteriales bacterium]MDD3333870.1 glycine betaine/L-proline ABC transporter ATP-binding protein [Proteiniphilum sp.]MDD4327099.1 glycine betaine/L-proline ABC transporter ATP-binding protein [Eubacteriales bacterium]MDD4717184.1 glycine betaine/L-proline ABC transporter ATP-binding protein [Eubacteriales bacterium]
MSKIIVRKLYKIFGSNHKKAKSMLLEGKSKDEILKKTGATIGIDDANFEVREGEIFVIMGLSGSGKSTVVRCLNRLIEPTSGEIFINGEDILKMDRKELLDIRRGSMSMVFQNFALLPNRSVLSNTEFGLELKGVDKSERAEKAKRSLELVGLKGYEDSLPDQLSGGMKQRVGLARALANDPEILLMDEAFSALDPLIRSDMQDELIDIQSKMKKTIIFITHDLDEAIKLGDRIMIMKDGKTAQIGTPEEILTAPADDYVKRFVQGVDKSKLLKAGDIMNKPWTTIRVNQGPNVALKELKKYSLDRLLVVGDQGRILLGAVTPDLVRQAVDEKHTNLERIVDGSLLVNVTPDTSIEDLIGITATNTGGPVTVVDDVGKLLGVIVRSTVLEALTNGKESGNDA